MISAEVEFEVYEIFLETGGCFCRSKVARA